MQYLVMPVSCAAFIRDARKAGFGGQFFNVSFVDTKALSDELGKQGAGVVVTQVVPSPYNSATSQDLAKTEIHDATSRTT